jgi:CubicO group peptidase (beta-lactamase class C family)/D-alanyl-D-alanine dipeptidase
MRRLALAVLLMAGAPALGVPAPTPDRPVGAESMRPIAPAVIAALQAAARAELDDKKVPSIALAVFDRSGILWSGAWGEASREGKLPATADTIYRAGSISKLLTDVAVMQLVEQGRLDLDAPITTYLPDFRPENPFATPITLRHLMTHRSGLVREPPRGHYFDSAAAGQADAVASLNQTRLVAEPGTLTKYSNAGIAVVGEVLARVTGKRFEEAVDAQILVPLGMQASHFSRAEAKAPVADSLMVSFDGGRWPAPAFELGTPAAGSLYTSANDLARFGQAMLNRGAFPGGRLLGPSTVDEMWRPQFPKTGPRAFGLGFVLGDIEGTRSVGHGGAVYGHVADLKLLPDQAVGVVVFATLDSGTTAGRLGTYALQLVLAQQTGGALPVWQRGEPVTGPAAQALAGRYVDNGDSLYLRPFNDGLVLDAPEKAAEVRRTAQGFLLDDAQAFDRRIAIAADGSAVMLGQRTFRRADGEPRPAPPAPGIADLVGEYGWDYNVLRIYERDGRPHVRIEWVDWLPLMKLGPDHFAFPADRGLYPLETLRFERDATGAVRAAMLGAIRFPRRDFGAEAEAQIRAAMDSGLPALRQKALAATPPAEPGVTGPSRLVDLATIGPTLKFDIRYAGTDNFMGQQIYEEPGAFLQKPAAEALVRIQARLKDRGFGLLIHDAYRPWYVTKMFWDATPAANRTFVADPSKGSRHNRGAAVDLTLIELKTGKPVVMTGRYDEFSSRSYSNHIGGTDEQRWLRDVLRDAMESEGFAVYPEEWWHFDFKGWQSFPIGNQRFQDIRKASLSGK